MSSLVVKSSSHFVFGYRPGFPPEGVSDVSNVAQENGEDMYGNLETIITNDMNLAEQNDAYISVPKMPSFKLDGDDEQFSRLKAAFQEENTAEEKGVSEDVYQGRIDMFHLEC